MEIRDYRQAFYDQLVPQYDLYEAESFFYLILEDLRKLRRVDLALHPHENFSDAEIAQWDQILEKLQKEIPIQYILGKTYFCGLLFHVNPNVLIPRPETEELVEWILENNSDSQKLRILDIGTGSGCIPISLAKKFPNAGVSAIDISTEALQTASENAVLNDVRVHFTQEDILATENLNGEFDIIVSNPPYVRELEKQEIRKNVLDNEPHLALFVADHDALLFYKKIAELAKNHLAVNGQLYFEINQYLAKETIGVLEQIGFTNITLRKDIYGNDRMIYAKKPL